MSGSAPADNLSYRTPPVSNPSSYRVTNTVALFFDILFSLLIAALLGFSLFYPVWFSYNIKNCETNLYLNMFAGIGTNDDCSTTTDTDAICYSWSSKEFWNDIDSINSNSNMEYDTKNTIPNIVIMTITSFVLGIALIIVSFNGCCCPINGRSRAQAFGTFFVLVLLALIITILVLISLSDVINTNYWEEYYASKGIPSSFQCSNTTTTENIDIKLNIAFPIWSLGIAGVLSVLLIFIISCGCGSECCLVPEQYQYVWNA